MRRSSALRRQMTRDGVVEVERAGDVGGGDLAHAVADHGDRARRPTRATARPSATWTANSSGWTTSMSSSRRVGLVGGQLLQQRPAGLGRDRLRRRRPMRRGEGGLLRRAARAPCPSHCEPCPGRRTRPGPPRPAGDRRRVGRRAADERVERRSTSSSGGRRRARRPVGRVTGRRVRATWRSAAPAAGRAASARSHGPPSARSARGGLGPRSAGRRAGRRVDGGRRRRRFLQDDVGVGARRCRTS